MKNATGKRTKRLAALLTALVMLFGIVPVTGALAAPTFEYLTCPEEAVSPFEEALLDRAGPGDDLLSNRGYEETGLYVSPYWTCRAAGKEVPVYAAMCYDGVPNKGVLSSFVYLFVSDFADGITLELDRGETVKNAVVLPTTLGATAAVSGSTVKFTADKTGIYTCLINDDCLLDAITIFVRDCPDEEAEIAAYREKYGADRVKVFAPGRYDLDYIETADCDALYFRRGAYLCATHLYDIRKEGDVASPRTFLDFYNKTDAVIDGFGILDFNRVDRNEIGYITISYCTDCSVEGLLCLNPASWNFATHAVNGLKVRDIAVFGYRTNSDALNVCCSENVTVSDCFARSGDDSFSAKTTAAGIPLISASPIICNTILYSPAKQMHGFCQIRLHLQISSPCQSPNHTSMHEISLSHEDNAWKYLPLSIYCPCICISLRKYISNPIYSFCLFFLLWNFPSVCKNTAFHLYSRHQPHLSKLSASTVHLHEVNFLQTKNHSSKDIPSDKLQAIQLQDNPCIFLSAFPYTQCPYNEYFLSSRDVYNILPPCRQKEELHIHSPK